MTQVIEFLANNCNNHFRIYIHNPDGKYKCAVEPITDQNCEQNNNTITLANIHEHLNRINETEINKLPKDYITLIELTVSVFEIFNKNDDGVYIKEIIFKTEFVSKDDKLMIVDELNHLTFNKKYLLTEDGNIKEKEN
ncbi:MAG: hypothetical protein HGB12_14535 [Bacteroidetes bacterium]|nr:hypothetical protein [Bacteroidota bacterium]